MRLSIIIPTYNKKESLLSVLSSLNKQTNGFDNYEVIVVDDGSSDETCLSVTKETYKYKLKYIYVPDEGFRVARARNIGSVNAEGDLLAFIDADVLVPSHFVRDVIGFHDVNSGSVSIGNVFGLYSENKWGLNVDIENIDKTLARMKESDIGMDIRIESYKRFNFNLNTMPAPWVFLWGTIFTVQKEVFDKVGRFDENFKSWGGEDIDLGYRLYKNHLKFHLVDGIEGIHLSHPENDEGNYQTNLDNKKYISEKYNTEETDWLVKEENIFNLNDSILLVINRGKEV
ncbi:glycosyltransferase [Vibrio crassostreae]|jgi:glycosyltransferase involved in cell wall biosynthesis|uniref:glycosyltransferase n=1 Tax=Vibrio crassostreae TaxID=246167 RepID=UPI0010481B43|nr:glycosyltransferase [Vibrio crassostreae]TCN98109.1 glycosyl transferase family 2 [Vibrio crassostreae]